jgi:serine/threonine protein kinase
MYGGWEIIRPLGSGGQSEVFLVRSPGRVQDRRNSLSLMDDALMLKVERSGQRDSELGNLATASWSYARPDEDWELGALKVFKIRNSNATEHTQEIRRLKNEIEALRRGFAGLPKLLAHDEADYWIVTECFREGSLERQLATYRNNPVLALKAFRSLVATVKVLHEQGDGMVHRDIKPANVFIRKDGELVLGDFGIVFLPDTPERVTETNERVGPRDYMAPWLDTGERVVSVTPCSDVYMLGKLLWCMISGRPKLSREFHRQRSFDLEIIFPNSPYMDRINLILDKCVVTFPHECLQSAAELLALVDKTLHDIAGTRDASRILPSGKLRLLCVMCGKGTYQPYTPADGSYVLVQQVSARGRMNEKQMRAYVCSVCTHHAFFAMGYPQEGEQKGWEMPKQPEVPGTTY